MGYCLSPWILVHFLRCFIHSHKTPVVLFSGLWLIQALLCWSFAIITGVCVLIGLGLWLSRRPWQDGTEAWRFTGGILKRAGLSLAMLVIPALVLFAVVYSLSTGTDAVYQRSISIFPSHLPWHNPQSNGFALSELFSPLSGGLRTVSGCRNPALCRIPWFYVDGHGTLGGLKGPFSVRFCLACALSFGALSWGDRSIWTH